VEINICNSNEKKNTILISLKINFQVVHKLIKYLKVNDRWLNIFKNKKEETCTGIDICSFIELN